MVDDADDRPDRQGEHFFFVLGGCLHDLAAESGLSQGPFFQIKGALEYQSPRITLRYSPQL